MMIYIGIAKMGITTPDDSGDIGKTPGKKIRQQRKSTQKRIGEVFEGEKYKEKKDTTRINRDNLEKFKEIGIIIDEEVYLDKKLRLYERDFDFKKFKLLIEKGLLNSHIQSIISGVVIIEINEMKIDFNKLTRLKNLGVDIYYFNIGELNATEIDFEKLTKLKKLGIEIDEYLVKKVSKLEIDFEKLTKLKKVGIEITKHNIAELNAIEIDFEKLTKLKKVGIEITKHNIAELNAIEIDFEKLTKLKKFGIKIDEYLIKTVSKLEIDFEKLTKLKKFGIKITEYNIKDLINLEISDKELSICKNLGITEFKDMKFFISLYKTTNQKKYQDYINRKYEYLNENRTLSKQRFVELFGGIGKFGKTEINQGGIGLCYAYTGFELIKKMNGFDELIQTNLKETHNGREVRLPFFNKEGIRIKINNDEINKEFTGKDKNGENRTFNINSENEYLGFKILEIAFIKNAILDKYLLRKDSEILPPSEALKKAYQQFKETGDITLTGELILDIEGGITESMLQSLLPKDAIIGGFSFGGLNNMMKDLAFNQFSKGLFMIGLSVINLCDDNKERTSKGISLVETKKYGKALMVKDAKIINLGGTEIISRFSINEFGKIAEEETKNNGSKKYNCSDIVTNRIGKDYVLFFQHHAYSIEKCYTDKITGEKRVWVINPRHTGIKIDLSLEQCKEIFEWNATGINIDALFR